mmetsp:Transcript_16605/g.33489  ORF Transcript_16605/g.33489 Transcript_16605/m.33489 type:complete len:103 (-) Transcript_16605:81-389(-)
MVSQDGERCFCLLERVLQQGFLCDNTLYLLDWMDGYRGRVWDFFLSFQVSQFFFRFNSLQLAIEEMATAEQILSRLFSILHQHASWPTATSSLLKSDCVKGW